MRQLSLPIDPLPSSHPSSPLRVLRERMEWEGPEGLSDEALLGLVLGSPEKAREALARVPEGIPGLIRALREGIPLGLTPAQQARIRAALELARRAARPVERPQIRSPEDAFRLLADMADLEQEALRVLLLNTRGQVTAVAPIYVGNVSAAVVRPAEIFREAVRRNAVSIIVAHNHPSGDPTPSPEDVALTRDLVAMGRLLGIAVRDHLVIARSGWISLRRERPDLFPN